jgi:hypothetical protein
MTVEEFVEAVGGDLNVKWQATFESGGYAYSNASFVLYDESMPISSCGAVADPHMDGSLLLLGELYRLLPALLE